jgi:general L-amino acid transport system permease protein
VDQGWHPVRAADPVKQALPGGPPRVAVHNNPKVRSAFYQAVALVVVLACAYAFAVNASDNLRAQGFASGFGFLNNTAGFGINQTLIDYSETDTYGRVFVVGLLNTLLVAIIGCVLATILGFVIGIARLSPNWLIARLGGVYVETIRNLPLLFQILFWYLAVLSALPNPRQSISLFGSFFLSNRGFVVPRPIGNPGFEPFVFAIVIAVVGSLLLRRYARKQLFDHGRLIRIWPYVLGMLIGLPLLSSLVFGAPVTFEVPELKGFNFAGGSRVIPEFVALALALATYTAAFIAEIVRAGIQSVHKGQMEAGSSLGLQRGSTLRLIVVPQAMRVILPPLTNQYLNLTKNSSLAVAIGYPDLVSVFAGTTLSQTGQAIEILAITMGVYLVISLVTSAIMSFYGWHIGRRSLTA